MSAHQKRKTFFDFFPPPQFLSLATAGISITNEDVKFAELKRSMLGGWVKPSLAKLVGINVATSLKNLVSKYGVKFANATIPDEKAYLFTTVIDVVSAEGLYDAVAFLIEGNVPLSLPESVFSYEIVGEYKGNQDGVNKLKLAVTVVPKIFIQTQLQLFESAGITIVSFDTESQAIARATVSTGDMRAQLIIHLTNQKAGLCVVDRGVVQFNTTLNRGSDGQLSEIKAKANEVLSFWSSRIAEPGNIGSKIEKVVICGLLPNQGDLAEALASMMNIEVVQANVWSNVSISGGQIVGVTPTEAIEFATAIGAGLLH